VLPQQPSGQLPSQHKKDEITTVNKGSGKKSQNADNKSISVNLIKIQS
jgi:hypothetical protein